MLVRLAETPKFVEMADPLNLPEQGKEIDFRAKKDLLKKAHDEMKQLKNVVQTSNSSVSATRDVSEDREALEEEPTEQGEVDIRNTNTELRAKKKDVGGQKNWWSGNY